MVRSGTPAVVANTVKVRWSPAASSVAAPSSTCSRTARGPSLLYRRPAHGRNTAIVAVLTVKTPASSRRGSRVHPLFPVRWRVSVRRSCRDLATPAPRGPRAGPRARRGHRRRVRARRGTTSGHGRGRPDRPPARGGARALRGDAPAGDHTRHPRVRHDPHRAITAVTSSTCTDHALHGFAVTMTEVDSADSPMIRVASIDQDAIVTDRGHAVPRAVGAGSPRPAGPPTRQPVHDVEARILGARVRHRHRDPHHPRRLHRPGDDRHRPRG